MEGHNTQEFRSLKRRYLTVYSLVVGADWLQGPHIYALYESYGISARDIAVLFVAGFASSMLLGTIVASYADKMGRGNVCFTYGLFYGLSCMTKHSSNFWILMSGRLLAGIATSIMCTTFEAWLVCENNKKGFTEAQLGEILSGATKANGIIAILSGIIAQFAVNLTGALVSPFDVATVVLVVTSILVRSTWAENYGDETAHHLQSFLSGYQSLKGDSNVLIAGLIQALFEGSMYIFVLQWTPALEQPKVSKTTINGPKMVSDPVNAIMLPHGYIFSAFMVAVALGSFLFSEASKRMKLEKLLGGVLLISCLAFLPSLIFPKELWIVFGGFLVFELCVGVFWPCMGALRGRYVPEACRSTLMNYFRIPVNLVVVVVLLQDGSVRTNFLCCAIFLAVCAVLPSRFKSKRSIMESTEKSATETSDVLRLSAGINSEL